MANLFCQRCATEITAKTRRCPTCGNKIKPPTEVEIDHPDVVDNRFEIRHDYVDPNDSRRTVNKKVDQSYQVKEPITFTDKTKKKSTSFVSQLPTDVIDFLKKYELFDDQAVLLLALSLFIPWVGIVLVIVAKSEKLPYQKALVYGTMVGFLGWLLLSLF